MSAVSMQNDLPQQLSKTTWFRQVLIPKRWTCALSECFFKEKPSFCDKPALIATFTPRKGCSFSVWVRYFKKKTLIGHIEWCTRYCVVYFTLDYAQFRPQNLAPNFIF